MRNGVPSKVLRVRHHLFGKREREYPPPQWWERDPEPDMDHKIFVYCGHPANCCGLANASASEGTTIGVDR